MLLNDRITISILRIFLSSEEKGNADEFDVVYKNGIYFLLNNFKKFEEAKSRGENEINVKICGNIEEVTSHIEYRMKKEKLNPIEMALLTRELEQIYNVKTAQIANHLGKTAGDLSNKKRLLKLPMYIQSDIIKENLTERHGRAFLQLINNNKEDKIEEIYRQVKIKCLKVSDTEKMIDKTIGKVVKDKVIVAADKNKLSKRIAVPAINQIESDFKNSVALIEKYYPELEVTKEEIFEDSNYVMKIIIKNVK